jgi:hypothetical protein
MKGFRQARTWTLAGLLMVMAPACWGEADGSGVSADPNHAAATGGDSSSNGGNGATGGHASGNGGNTAPAENATGSGGSTAVGGAASSTGGTGSEGGTGASTNPSDRCPGAVRWCADGSAACDLGECPSECAPGECEGPRPDVTRVFCQDQTIGGPYCARDDSGACAWGQRECPDTNECDDDVIACTDDTATTRVPPDCNTYGHCQVFCEPGTRYFVPGCASDGDSLLPEPGCYVSCAVDGVCPEGARCTDVVTNPCAFSTCAACGDREQLCLPD